jgi:hypothetical protein
MNINQALELARQKLSWVITGKNDTPGDVQAVLDATDPAKLQEAVTVDSIKAERYDWIIKHMKGSIADILQCEPGDVGTEVDERIELGITPNQRNPNHVDG